MNSQTRILVCALLLLVPAENIVNAQCLPGLQINPTKTNECEFCVAGKYSDWNSIACQYCISGKYSSGQATYCSGSACVIGKFGNFGANLQSTALCWECPAGTYSSTAGTSTCTICTAGKYSLTAGTSTCTNCAAGKFSGAAGASAASTCADCAAGKLSYGGASVCTNCGAGKYSGAVAAEVCTACDPGKYSDLSGASSCTLCPAGKLSRSPITTNCFDCWPGGYNDVEGSWGNACKQCAAGKSSMLAASSCFTCPVGKFSEKMESPECTECAVGKFSVVQGATTVFTCQNCDAGEYAASGASSCTKCASGKYSVSPSAQCTECAVGKFSAVQGASNNTCQNCDAGTYAASSASSCNKCPSGKYSASYSSAQCTECPAGKYADELASTICICCDSGKYSNVSQATTGSTCKNCEAGKFAKSNASTACEKCPSDHYAGSGSDICMQCPENSGTVTSQKQLEDCFCSNSAFVKTYEGASFKCACPENYYFQNETCKQCAVCEDRQWRKGCEASNAGSCVACSVCQKGQYLVHCNYVSEGKCIDQKWLSREPLCPVMEALNKNFRQEVGVMQDLGGFGFATVFGVESTRAPFACSTLCDGTTHVDGTQCGGPFACGVRTCVQNMRADISSTGSLYDVLVCPVRIHEDDSDAEKQKKIDQPCVSCAQCGSGAAQARHWGEGCARECSQLRCPTDEIWDWTVKGCVACNKLRDERLCMDFDARKNERVTGNLKRMYFKDCVANGRLDDLKYGTCTECQEPEDNACAGEGEYPDTCASHSESSIFGVVLNDLIHACGSCARTYQGDVNVVTGKYQKELGGANSHLYCQITPCNLQAGSAMTGVQQHAICTDRCISKTCNEHEILIPCRLPHQTRCDTVWPQGIDVAPAFKNQRRTKMAGPDVNLFSERKDTLKDSESPTGFASFENTLITLSSMKKHHYQCVWNAASIVDNRFFPGGISEYMFPPGLVYASTGERGSKACELWDITDYTPFPLLLPLQNTVSGTSDRRVLINSEAHVLSYDLIDGAFTFVDKDLEPKQQIGSVDVRLKKLEDAHLGGSGELYLMLTLRTKAANVTIDVPQDRNLTSWPKSLLLTCAVARMSPVGASSDVLFSVHVQRGTNEAMQPLSQARVTWSYSELFHNFDFGLTTAFTTLDFGHQVCSKKSGKNFLEQSARVLSEIKAVPIQITITLAKFVPENPLVLFFRPRAFNSSLVAGCNIVHKEVRVGEESKDRLEREQRKALLLMQNFTALRHVDLRDSVFRRTLNWASNDAMQQSHAVDAYSKCAVLMTTNKSIFCAGSEGLEELWDSNVSKQEPRGVGFLDISDNQGYVLALLKNLDKTQQLYVLGNESRSPLRKVQLLAADAWVSFAVQDSGVDAPGWDIVALARDEKQKMTVHSYSLRSADDLWDEDPMQLIGKWPVFDGRMFPESSWMSFSRVVMMRESEYVVAVTVLETEDLSGVWKLELSVCAVQVAQCRLRVCAVKVARCGKVTMEKNRDPSFISVALLAASADLHERWVVGVHGKVFEFVFAEVVITHEVSTSELREGSFVQVGAAWQVQQKLSQRADGRAMQGCGLLYYKMHLSMLKDASLLAFLPEFERRDATQMWEEAEEEKGVKIYNVKEAYEVLVAYTHVPKSEQLNDLTICIAAVEYRESRSGEPASAIRGVPENIDVKNRRELKAAFAWRARDDMPLEVGLPLVIGGNTQEQTDLGDRDSAATPFSLEFSLALLLGVKCADLDSDDARKTWAFLVRVGYARTNHQELRGLSLVGCSSDENYKCSSAGDASPSTISEVYAHFDSGERDEIKNAVVTFENENWRLYVTDNEGALEERWSGSGPTCIALAPGSGIVMARQYASISDRIVRALWQGQDVQEMPPQIVPAQWLRERRVLDAAQQMRVALRFERKSDSEPQCPSIGLDDVQLLPMLSGSTAFVDGYLEADVEMPSDEEMRSVDLAHLLRKADSRDDVLGNETGFWESNWERLHVTVALKLAEGKERNGCEYMAEFYHEEKDGKRFVLPVGCEFTASSAQVRGAWAQCMLELPLHMPDMQLLVRISVWDPQPRCALIAEDLVLVFIDANTALYECAPGYFLAGGATLHAGQCVPCRGLHAEPSTAPTLAQEAQFCTKGFFLKGCPALLSKSHMQSGDCTECHEPPAGAVFAEVLREAAEPCKWQCKEGYHATGHGSERKCLICRKPFTCEAGLYWTNCSETADSTCAACPDLRNRSDTDGQVYERYIDAADEIQQHDRDIYPGTEDAGEAAGGTLFCRSRCLNDAFRSSEDNLCKRCTRPQDVLEERELETDVQIFWAVVACSPAADTFARPCEERDGSTVVASDPAATGDCPRECLPGWEAKFNTSLGYNDSCVLCANVTVVDGQSAGPAVVMNRIAPDAVDFAAFTLNSCALACKRPYVLLRERQRWMNESNAPVPEDLAHFQELDEERTCVRCSEHACDIGSYPTGLLCACEACSMPDAGFLNTNALPV